MPSIGDLVYRVGYTQQGVGIVTQTSTTAEQSGLLKGKGFKGRAIYRIHWQNSPVLPACTGWLFAHQLVSATKEKQLSKQ